MLARVNHVALMAYARGRTLILFARVIPVIMVTVVRVVSTHFIYSIIHYNDVIMNAMASQITSLTIVCSTVYSRVDQRKHQSSTSPGGGD